MAKNKPFWVEIEWGTESTRAENDTRTRKEFSTQAELDAYLEGVDDMDGWSEWNIVDSSAGS